MDENETFTANEQLLLMAAAVHEMGPGSDIDHANTARVVNQALWWRGLSADEINKGWWGEEEEGYPPIHEEVYNALIRMTHETHSVGPGRVPERPGVPLFEGGGNWGVPGDPSSPACVPLFNSCRLTVEGERVGKELLERHPEYRERVVGRKKVWLGPLVLLKTDPATASQGNLHIGSFVKLMNSIKCRKMLSHHVGADLTAVFSYAQDLPSEDSLRKEYGCDEVEAQRKRAELIQGNEAAWHTPGEVLAAANAMIAKLPGCHFRNWSDEEREQYGNLYAELSAELQDFEYFYHTSFVQNLYDLLMAVERASAADAKRVRLYVL